MDTRGLTCQGREEEEGQVGGLAYIKGHLLTAPPRREAVQVLASSIHKAKPHPTSAAGSFGLMTFLYSKNSFGVFFNNHENGIRRVRD